MGCVHIHVIIHCFSLLMCLYCSHSYSAVASQSLQQQIVKRLQTVIASLPEAQRPKTIPELRDFVQKYSSLITQNNLLDLSVPSTVGSLVGGKSTPLTSTNTLPPRAGPSLSAADVNARFSQSSSIPSLLNNTPVVNPGAKLSHLPPLPPPHPAASVGPAQINNVMPQSPSAQVAEHFKSSLASLAASSVQLPTSSRASSSGPTVGGAVAAVPSVLSASSSNPLPVGLVLPGFASGGVSATSTVHAPVTTQFSHKMGSSNSLLPSNQASRPPTASQAPPLPPHTATSSGGTVTPQCAAGIQPGVATPLPPGLTLETLGVLCRLPESDLLKLKLPPALLSAIKVWKARQPPTKSVAKVSIVF